MKKLAENIWVFEKPFRLMGAEMGNRMTVVRMKNGELFIHSPIGLTEEIESKINELGDVACVVTPNLFHGLYVTEWLNHYPSAYYFSANKKVLDGSARAKPLNQITGLVFSDDVEWLEVKGLPRVNEILFFHKSSRTLIVTDLAFNIGQDVSLWSRVFFTLTGAYNKFGPSRLMKSMIKDPALLRASLEKALEWNFDRIIVSHGDVIEGGGKERFLDGFKDYLK